MELDCVLPLKALLKTCPESAITLLSALSAHPPNNVRFPTHTQVGLSTVKWLELLY